MFPKSINNENLILTQIRTLVTCAYFFSGKAIVIVPGIGIGTWYRQVLKTMYLYLVIKKWYRCISSFHTSRQNREINRRRKFSVLQYINIYGYQGLKHGQYINLLDPSIPRNLNVTGPPRKLLTHIFKQ